MQGTTDLSQSEFEILRRLIKGQAGIHLGEGKETLLKARLSKRLRVLGLKSYGQYIDVLGSAQGAAELTELLDAIATNVTSFFRQPAHFEYLRNLVLPHILAGQKSSPPRLRIWSAACSTGEEPYSIGMHLREGIPNLNSWDARILATDISTMALGRARSGAYDAKALEGFPRRYAERYLDCKRGGGQPQGEPLQGSVKALVKELITFARINLMGDWNMEGPFDAIFCRNVMIYFDKPTQQQLVERFRHLLVPGGTLFIGHSESLTGIQNGYKVAGPAIYTKA